MSSWWAKDDRGDQKDGKDEGLKINKNKTIHNPNPNPSDDDDAAPSLVNSPEIEVAGGHKSSGPASCSNKIKKTKQ